LNLKMTVSPGAAWRTTVHRRALSPSHSGLRGTVNSAGGEAEI
jgi:hypothetical protein